MTVMDILHKWDNWNIPLVINDNNLNRIVRFESIAEFGFGDVRERKYDYLCNRSVLSLCVYDGELCIRIHTHNAIPYERAIEIASMAIDGLREDDEETAQEYLLKEVGIEDDFERKFFGLGKIEEEE